VIFISLTRAKKELERLLESVSEGQRVIITKFGKPVVEIKEIDINLYKLSIFSSGQGYCLLNG